jgi:hypothetical protein
MSFRAAALLVALAVAAGPARADVVLNEILYHAPDDLDDLQFIELHNPGNRTVDLAGWKLTRGVRYEFPAGTSIAADGYLVVCKNLKEFKKHYGSDAAGQFTGSLRHNHDHVELVNARGKTVDSVRYNSRAPWPVAADGYSASLERICPTASEQGPENWAPSPLAAGTPKPGGTPGKKNANYAPRLPPVITDVIYTPSHASPGQEVSVQADVRSPEKIQDVELRYRVAASSSEQEEKTVRMAKGSHGRYAATIPAQKAGQIIRFRIRAADAKGGERFYPNVNDLRPAMSVYVHEPFRPGKLPFGLVVNVGAAEFRAALRDGQPNFGGPQPTPPARGKSAFVYVSEKTGEPELFDFINVTPRVGGRKVRFHKDHPLGDMTTINLIYEYMDRFVLSEPLAYEVYHRAGNAAPRTDHVRTWIDGRPIGFQLLIEQPNKAFLRHNELKADGNMYKCLWYGNGLIGSHEKKTHTHSGHDDLVQLVAQLSKTKGEEQWAVICKNFDVPQVATFFAAHTVLSDWDGYFNNHFVYHDVSGSGKWTMYPWDQDKTWGFHDGIRGYEVFFDMPLTFGAEGDRPPGFPKDRPPPPGFGGGAIWWRPGGYISKPVLANPQFRKVYLARTRDLLEQVYTEEIFFPLIAGLGERLEEEVQLRAKLRREDPKKAVEHFRRNLQSLREHVTKRRKFLLEQDEIKKAGKFDRAELN